MPYVCKCLSPRFITSPGPRLVRVLWHRSLSVVFAEGQCSFLSHLYDKDHGRAIFLINVDLRNNLDSLTRRNTAPEVAIVLVTSGNRMLSPWLPAVANASTIGQ